MTVLATAAARNVTERPDWAERPRTFRPFGMMEMSPSAAVVVSVLISMSDCCSWAEAGNIYFYGSNVKSYKRAFGVVSKELSTSMYLHKLMSEKCLT